MKYKLDNYKIFAIFIIIFVMGIVVYRGYTEKLNNYTKSSTFDTLTEIAAQQKFNLVQRKSLDIRSMESLAFLISKEKKEGKAENRRIKKFINKTHFSQACIVDINGKLLAGSEVIALLPDKKTIDNIIRNGSELCDVIQDPKKHKSYIAVAVPVVDSRGTSRSAAIGYYPAERLTDLLLPFYQGQGTTYVVCPNGQIIAASGQSVGGRKDHLAKGRFWEGMERTVYAGYDTVKEMKGKIDQKDKGQMLFYIKDQKKYMHYETAGVNDWYLFTAVGEETIAENINAMLHDALKLSLVIIGLLFLLLLYILRLQRRHNGSLMQIAYFDELCNCSNLQKFKLDVQQFMNTFSEKKFMLAKFDIDRFKLVNQILGQEAGDQILINVATALRESEDEVCKFFARAHDDEFYVLYAYENTDRVPVVRKQMTQKFYQLMGEEFHYHIKFVAGYYCIDPIHNTNAADAVEKANVAHRKAKEEGIDLYFYDDSLVEEALHKKKIEEQMEQALYYQEFKVFFQPQYSLNGECIIGAEALVRWQDESGTIIYPDEFISIFEENRFIIRLDLYMFDKVCQLLQQWISEGLNPPAVSVNFSRYHLADTAFVEQLCKIADRYQVPRQLLEVELTERVISQDENLSLHILDRLHDNGFTLVMDDFGVGYSSLGLLKNVPVDVLKIDKSFFERAGDQPRSRAVLLNVIRLAKDLNAYTVAEGVETKDIAEMLKEFGCDAVQGYYYGRPVPAEQFKKSL